MISAETPASGAVRPLSIARAAVGKESRVRMVAPCLGHHVPAAKGNPAFTIGAAILGSAVTVGSPPPSCQIGAPPVRICADSAIVLLIPDLDVVLGLEVLDGPQGASAGQWSNEGDLNLRCDAVWVAPNWEGSNAAAAGAAGTAASIGSGGGDGGQWRDGNGSGISGSRPQRESRVATRNSRAKSGSPTIDSLWSTF